MSLNTKSETKPSQDANLEKDLPSNSAEKKGSEDPINRKLFAEIEAIKEKRRLLIDRLEKADKQKGDFSDTVFHKVLTEYNQNISDLGLKLSQLKSLIDKECTTLSKMKSALEKQLKTHERVVEESALRHKLGEFDESKYKGVAARESESIARLKGQIEAYGTALVDYDQLFEGEELPETPTDQIKVPTKTLTKKQPARELESDYLALPEEDEFKKSSPEKEASEKDTTKESTGEKTEPKLELPVPVIVQMESHQEIQQFKLDSDLSLGRSPSNDIVISEPRVSRRHATIEKRGENFVLVDLDSSNGTFVKGKKIKEHTFAPGDLFQVGGINFTFKA